MFKQAHICVSWSKDSFHGINPYSRVINPGFGMGCMTRQIQTAYNLFWPWCIWVWAHIMWFRKTLPSPVSPRSLFRAIRRRATRGNPPCAGRGHRFQVMTNITNWKITSYSEFVPLKIVFSPLKIVIVPLKTVFFPWKMVDLSSSWCQRLPGGSR